MCFPSRHYSDSIWTDRIYFPSIFSKHIFLNRIQIDMLFSAKFRSCAFSTPQFRSTIQILPKSNIFLTKWKNSFKYLAHYLLVHLNVVAYFHWKWKFVPKSVEMPSKCAFLPLKKQPKWMNSFKSTIFIVFANWCLNFLTCRAILWKHATIFTWNQ